MSAERRGAAGGSKGDGRSGTGFGEQDSSSKRQNGPEKRQSTDNSHVDTPAALPFRSNANKPHR